MIGVPREYAERTATRPDREEGIGMNEQLKFKKRWGVPEGLLYDGGTWGWDVGGYQGQLWNEKRYACDIGAPRMCWLERVYAAGPKGEEICRRHVTGDDRVAFDAYAERAEASFREAAERACAASGHIRRIGGYLGLRDECYCVEFFASEEAATARA